MEPEKKSNGALFGSIVIIIILIVGGIYVWQSKVQSALEQKKIQADRQAEIQMQANELNALEQDINSTDTNITVDVKGVN